MTIALAPGGPGAPCLRADLAIVEQVFRGETSFVVKDPATQKYFRFRPVEMGVMRCFNGQQTHDQIAETLESQGVRLSARAVEAFARKLASIGLLERTLVERTTLELERIRAQRRQRRQRTLFRGELLRMRWSFGDHDATLTRWMPHVRWMFTKAFVIVSALLFATYFSIVGATWTEFSQAVTQHFSPFNLTIGSVLILWGTLLVVTFIHELGHTFACKHFGGEVHEVGFMLVYFQPAFYANVNDAWSFTSLSSRLWVTAAGGWIELVFTALAAMVWLFASPDTLVSELAVAVMVIGGGFALLTNANPLMPLDGYFALIDWLEIPNLRHRAREYVTWWIRRNVLRLEVPEPPATDRERRVLLTYGVLAAAYALIFFTIFGLWLMGRAGQAFGALGVLTVLTLVFALVRKGVVAWWRSAATALHGRRATRARGPRWRGLLVGALAALLILALMPWTLTTTGAFVVAPVRTLDVTASDSAVIAAIYVREGVRVEAGAPLARLIDRKLERELLEATRAADSLGVAGSRARSMLDAGATGRLEAERAAATARLASIRSRVDALTMRAQWGGVVTTPRVEELVGQRVVAGDRVMRVAMLDSLEARVSLTRAGAASVAQGQVAHLIAYGDVERPVDAAVSAVAAGAADSTKMIEARVPVRPGTWRAGATGEASIELRRSTALGAIWWGVRQLVRNDLWI
jgi:multidrug efflux pump subunit AcrA (membrane-fusion protein)